jgi:pimeloyl-ACP methyl ester carboxylesterase
MSTAVAVNDRLATPSENIIEVLDAQVSVQSAGSGDPLVIFHRDTGRTWSPLHDRLSRERTVIAPSLPGFHPSARNEWTRNCTELGIQAGYVLDALNLSAVPVFGLGFGGWIAAELALSRPELVASLVLHAPMGLKPTEGHYLDQFLISAREYMVLGFSSLSEFETVYGSEQDDETARIWDNERETITRIAWSPYLYNPSLSHMLPALRVPVTVLCSANDQVVPASVPSAYLSLIPQSELCVLEDAPHRAEYEAPDGMADAVLHHLTSQPRVAG